MVLPNGTGETQSVLVFARGAKAEEAKLVQTVVVVNTCYENCTDVGWTSTLLRCYTWRYCWFWTSLDHVTWCQTLKLVQYNGCCERRRAPAGKSIYRADKAGIARDQCKVLHLMIRLLNWLKLKAFNDTIQNQRTASVLTPLAWLWLQLKVLVSRC